MELPATRKTLTAPHHVPTASSLWWWKKRRRSSVLPVSDGTFLLQSYNDEQSPKHLASIYELLNSSVALRRLSEALSTLQKVGLARPTSSEAAKRKRKMIAKQSLLNILAAADKADADDVAIREALYVAL